MARPARIDVHLVCGGRWHDMDYARLELLKLLAEHERLRVTVAPDYRDSAALSKAQLLVTYTCDVIPDEPQQQELAGFLARGGRWFALHGTNSILKWSKEQKAWTAPRNAPAFMQMLGSQFLAHPAIEPFRVHVSDPAHPLTQGLESFEADDELYLCEYHGDSHALLHAHFDGEAPGFVDREWRDPEQRHLVLYLRRHGGGEILYCTLGHCRGHYDMQPMMSDYPTVERGSWKLPVFHEILRRGIRWGARLDG